LNKTSIISIFSSHFVKFVSEAKFAEVGGRGTILPSSLFGLYVYVIYVGICDVLQWLPMEAVASFSSGDDNTVSLLFLIFIVCMPADAHNPALFLMLLRHLLQLLLLAKSIYNLYEPDLS
jgi:hypothetical protein